MNWDDRNIEIVCCKKKNFNKSLVYNPINFNKIYTYMNRSVQYDINKQNIIVINPETKQSLNFTLPNNEDFKWELILNGKKKLSDIMNNFDESYNKNLHEVLKIMIENSLLDISYFPIVNYYNYYNK